MSKTKRQETQESLELIEDSLVRAKQAVQSLLLDCDNDESEDVEFEIRKRFELFAETYKYDLLTDDGEYVRETTNRAYVAWRDGFLDCHQNGA